MFSKQWLTLFALLSLSIAWYLSSHTLARVTPRAGTSRAPSATSTPVLSSSTRDIRAASTTPSRPKPASIVSKPVQQKKSFLATTSPATPMPPAVLRAPVPPVEPSQADIASQIARKVHDLINAERTGAGLVALSYDAMLSSIAKAHTADMLAKGYFDHTDPDGCSFSCRIKKSGFDYRAISENIFTMYGYKLDADAIAARIVQGWMNSPGHRANILNPEYATEGIGVSISGDTVLATEDLAKPE